MDKFIQWSQLIMCDKIKPNEKVVLMVILNCNNMAWPFIAHTEIMKQSGLSESTTKRALAKLKKMGLITEVKSNTNNMNNYIVSGFNLNGLITSGVNLTPQVGSKTTISGFNLTCNNNINKKENIVKREKENIKEKRESNEMINGKLNRKDEVKEKQSNNNIDFKKNGMYMELNSHPAVQSKDWTKVTKEEKTHSSSAGTTKVIQIGDTRYAVSTANTEYSSIWDSFPGGTASRENKKVQRVTTTEDRKDNTLSNASLHNDNEDNPNEDKPTTAGQNTNPKTADYNHEAAGATETAHRGFNGTQVDNYPTHAEKTPQERDLEGILETETADDETDSPNNGANTADATNTLSKEDTQRIMSQAAQTIMKNRKHAAKTDDDKIYKAFIASINGANTAADAQKAPKNDRGEEIIPQVDNYTIHTEKTPQERYFDNMGADPTAVDTENAQNKAHSEEIIPQVDNYTTAVEKTPQERNNEGNMDTHNPMDCGGMSIDDLEDIYNGGNQTQPISKVRFQTTFKAKSNEGGGGRKFTPRKEWDIAMEEANHHIDNSNPYSKPLVTVEDLRIITEGTTDKYRVIETLKAIKKMLSFRLKYTVYDIWLNDALDTLEANEKEYTEKQLNYAYEIHDDCVDLYNIITNK